MTMATYLEIGIERMQAKLDAALARAEAAEARVAELKYERNTAARRAYNAEVDNQQLTAENRRLVARVADLEALMALGVDVPPPDDGQRVAELAAAQWRPVTE